MSQNKTYRIRTTANATDESNYLKVKLEQDYDILELLSLKINMSSNSVYRTQSSNYGCIAGRVLGNNSVGIPNAKVSAFVPAEGTDSAVIASVYPYKDTGRRNNNGVRYNLLPDTTSDPCHVVVGTFPNKRLTLDDNTTLEVYDKYYKFTTVTNNSGDYMLFGVPTGNTKVHVDVDLSDIGYLSQTPRDMMYKGYNSTQFENASMFKESSNLDSLVQIKTQNSTIEVKPFWGDENLSELGITRYDVNIDYTFEPTCVFMGSIISEEKSNGINEKCFGSKQTGEMKHLMAGRGTIEMIRKRSDGTVESFQIKGTELIDGDGVWCYQIPMNLDYMVTDEYGNLVPSGTPEKGIPTRARVRFRFSLTDTEAATSTYHLAKVLVPNNPETPEDIVDGKNYIFGTNTNDDKFGTKDFRDIFWNNVYTVKSYIPRIQKGNGQREKRFTGIKAVNISESNNPIPYNNIRIDLSFKFILQCAIMKVLIWFTTIWNNFVCACPSHVLGKKIHDGTCSRVGDGACSDLEGWYFAPGCGRNKRLRKTLNKIQNEDNDSIDKQNKPDEPICVTNKIDHLMQCIELNLAQENDVINFDFYNDWLNGTLYIPRWHVHFRKKKTYFFGLFRRKARVSACTETGFRGTRRLVEQCALSFKQEKDEKGEKYFSNMVTPIGCGNNRKLRCHKGAGRRHCPVLSSKYGSGGLIREQPTYAGQTVYYIKPAEWFERNNKNVKVFLYATDMVLLGSLTENNIYGIPKVSNELVGSTFVMPSDLAETNLNDVGYRFGLGEGRYICNNTVTTEKIEVQDEDWAYNDDYQQWSKGRDFYDPSLIEEAEYPITIAAGVDWGYTGPQLSTKFKGQQDKLFRPGGHFLGISCFNAESNIKSCVNLTRACEINSSLSRRQSVVVPAIKDGENGYTIDYIAPTGVISRNEIEDGDFRSIFSTLNFNSLRSKYNDKHMLIYDFTVLNPKNFAGELKSYVENKPNLYNSQGWYDSGEADLTGTTVYTPAIYTQTLEAFNTDYYRFRMGYKPTQNVDDLSSHYLVEESRGLSMPAYRNSFYFYFGLTEGNTAYDKMMADYFSECPDKSLAKPSIEGTATPADFCIGNNGTVIIKIENLIGPYYITVYNADDVMENPLSISATTVALDEFDVVNVGGSIYGETDSDMFIIGGLSANTDYRITVSTAEVDDMTITAHIGTKYPDEVEKVNVEGVDFADFYNILRERYNAKRSPDEIIGTDVEPGSLGYISFNINEIGIDSKIVGFKIANESAGKLVPLNSGKFKEYPTVFCDGTPFIQGKIDYSDYLSSSLSIIYASGNTGVWKGDELYEISVLYDCSDNAKKNVIEIPYGTIYIAMPGNVDFYIKRADEDDNDFTFNRYIKPLLDYGIRNNDSQEKYEVSDDSWYKYLLRYGYGLYYSDDRSNTIIYNKNIPEGKERFIDDNAIYTLKNALYYNKSLYEQGYTHSIEVGVLNAKGTYSIDVTGYGERLDEDDNLEVKYFSGGTVEAAQSGYSLDVESIMLPTMINNGFNKPSLSLRNEFVLEGRKNVRLSNGTIIINTKIDSGDTKGDYVFHLANGVIDGFPETGLTIPVIYAPFMFTVVVNEDIGYKPNQNKPKVINYYTGETEGSVTVYACDEIYHDTQLYYRIYNGITDGQHRLKSIEIIDGNGNKLMLESIANGGTKLTLNDVVINTNNATDTPGETTTTTTTPFPSLNITRNCPDSATTTQQYDIFQSGLTYQDFYPVVVNTISAITENIKKGGGYKASGLTIPLSYLEFEDEVSKRTKFLFRVTDWGGNVIEENISEMFYGENRPYCSADLAQYVDERDDFAEWKKPKISGYTPNWPRYLGKLNYLPYYNKYNANEWVGRATQGVRFLDTTYVQPNKGKRQDERSLDYESPGWYQLKTDGYKYHTFVQFYDTFTDFENGNERGDVTIDTIYKQWTIDTNRVSFIKNFLELSSGNFWNISYNPTNPDVPDDRVDPVTENLKGWWNAFGAQLYYSTIEKEQDDS